MAKSREQCRLEAKQAGHKPGMPDFEDYVENCILGGGEQQPPKSGASPCKAGGYLGQQVQQRRKWMLIKPCKPGFKPYKATDGRIWCCREKEEEPGDTNGGDTGGGGKGCEGGYRLSESPITTPGPGSQEKAEIGGGWVRDPRGQGHFYHHKNYGWHDWETAEKQVKEGIEPKFRASVCPKNHELKVIDGVEWCCPSAGGGEGTTTAGGGEFKWSPEMQKMIEGLRGRYEYLMKYPRGTSPEERQSIINYIVSGIKKGERGEIQSMKDQLARIGMLGQPLQIGETERIKRGTRELTSKARTEVGIDELDRRYKEMIGTTGLSQSLLSTLLGTEQVPEVLSSARRSEQKDYMAMLLNYLSTIMGGGSNDYWQAILNYMSQGEGGSDFSDWLPYLGYYLGNK